MLCMYIHCKQRDIVVIIDYKGIIEFLMEWIKSENEILATVVTTTMLHKVV